MEIASCSIPETLDGDPHRINETRTNNAEVCNIRNYREFLQTYSEPLPRRLRDICIGGDEAIEFIDAGVRPLDAELR